MRGKTVAGKRHKKLSPIERVENCLEEVMAIDIDELEQLVQQAHECAFNQIKDPAEIFSVSRQALRMLWQFRRNLEAVEIHAEPGTAEKETVEEMALFAEN